MRVCVCECVYIYIYMYGHGLDMDPLGMGKMHVDLGNATVVKALKTRHTDAPKPEVSIELLEPSILEQGFVGKLK